MSDNQYKPTVMPHDESLEQQKAHGGAPGLFRASDPHQIDAFKNVSDVSAQDLNERLQAQDAARIQPGGHGLQRISGSVPHEEQRDSSTVNAALQAQDEAHRAPHTAVPGPVVPGQDNLGAFTKDD